MPATGSLLSESERLAFAKWLTVCIETSGRSKSDVVREVFGADDSNQRLNRYLVERADAKPVPPSVKVVRSLADALHVPRLVMLTKAGYLSEIPPALVTLETLAKFTRRRMFLEAAVELGVYALPRRGDAHAAQLVQECSSTMRVAFAHAVLQADTPRHQLPPLLARAKDVLGARDLDAQLRRFVAAEFVAAYVDELDKHYADEVRARIPVAPQNLAGAIADSFQKAG